MSECPGCRAERPISRMRVDENRRSDQVCLKPEGVDLDVVV